MLDFFNIMLPMAGFEFNVLVLLALGFTVGVCGGFFGIGGAWIITPGLNIFGFPMAYAIGTDLAHIFGKSIIATMRHAKFGNVDAKLAVSIFAGAFVGIEVGARFVMFLEKLGLAGPVIRYIYIALLGTVSLFIFYDYFKTVGMAKKGEVKEKLETGKVKGVTFSTKIHSIFKIPPYVTYGASGVTCSMWLPILLGLLIGVVVSILGVGGGFICMPSLIYIIGAPTTVAVGTDLFQVLMSGAYGAFKYSYLGRCDLVAAMWMICAAAIGAQIGTVATKYVRGYGIRFLFALQVGLAAICVAFKQAGFTTLSAVLIIAAGMSVCGIIVWKLVAGMRQEIREKAAA